MLTVSNLTVVRGFRDLLTDVSFSVGAGERIAILGPNGSGKSTLMECIAGRLTPRSGSVTRNPPALAVGYLHQSYDVADIAETVGELVESDMALEDQLAATAARLAASPNDPRAEAAYTAALERYRNDPARTQRPTDGWRVKVEFGGAAGGNRALALERLAIGSLLRRALRIHRLGDSARGLRAPYACSSVLTASAPLLQLALHEESDFARRDIVVAIVGKIDSVELEAHASVEIDRGDVGGLRLTDQDSEALLAGMQGDMIHQSATQTLSPVRVRDAEFPDP